jgi:ADP-ribose pyrophosphatase YjhB (NUDIX family)
MPGRSTEEESSAGGVVYRMQEGAPHFLLIRDSYRNWGFPKGHLKKGELPERAALREVREETGLEALTLRGDAGTIDWSFQFRGRRIHKRCQFYLMESPGGRTRPQRAEGITECVWLPYGDALERLSYENAREVLVRALEVLGALDGGAAAPVKGRVAGG